MNIRAICGVMLFFYLFTNVLASDRVVIVDYDGLTYSYDYNTNTYTTLSSTTTYHGDQGSGVYDSESNKLIFISQSASTGQVRAYDYSTNTWETKSNRPGTRSETIQKHQSSIKNSSGVVNAN